MPVVIAVHGPSGSGKTTLIEQVVSRLHARGLSVGVVKHAHDGFALDQRGKDSQRFWEAGAQAVLVAAPQELFLRQRSAWSRLSELLGLLPQELDCVFIEGFVHTTTAMDVPVSVRIELTGGGARLNGQLIPRNEVAAAVEAVTATTVTMTVLFFAQLRDRFGADALQVALPLGATGADLMRWLAERNPKVDGLLAVSRLAINCEYVSLDHRLQDGDEVVVIPPVSGG